MANVGYLLLLSQGVDSIDREQVNDWEYLDQVQKAKREIPKQVAKVWLEMQQKGCLPSWAINQIKVDMMSKAAL